MLISTLSRVKKKSQSEANQVHKIRKTTQESYRNWSITLNDYNFCTMLYLYNTYRIYSIIYTYCRFMICRNNQVSANCDSNILCITSTKIVPTYTLVPILVLVISAKRSLRTPYTRTPMEIKTLSSHDRDAYMYA